MFLKELKNKEYRRKKRLGKSLCVTLLSAVMITTLCGCNKTTPVTENSENPPTVVGENSFPTYTEEVKVVIPGMEEEVKLIYFSDLHIVTDSAEVLETEKENVNGRILWSSAANGVSSAEQWGEWPEILNRSGADYLLFGGDMVDFASDTNIEVMKEGFDRLTIPYLYIRADHDYLPTYLNGISEYDGKDRQAAVCSYKDVESVEYEDFIVVGWNNSTSNLTEEGLAEIQRLAEKNKPMILLTHVPIEPLNDTSLEEASRAIFQDRSLIWGYSERAYYKPNTPTSALLNMIYAEDSPFVEVLAGHLHLTWDGMITEHVHQHVFSNAFNGYYGIVTVQGE